MPIAQSLLAEFEAQAPVTRRFLERLPDDKLTWKPHPRSLTAGQLAYHLAFVPEESFAALRRTRSRRQTSNSLNPQPCRRSSTPSTRASPPCARSCRASMTPP